MWNSACKKNKDAALKWSNQKLGFFFGILACNVYLLPVFSYIAQLANLDDSVLSAEAFMRNRLFSGPGNWLPKSFLTNAKEFGFPVSLRDLRVSSQSAKIRVLTRSTLDIDTLSTDITLGLFRIQAAYGHHHPAAQWHANAFAINLTSARNSFISAGGQLQRLHERPNSLQSKIHKQLLVLQPCTLQLTLHTMSNRLSRFKLSVHGTKLQYRIKSRIDVLRASPRVALLHVFVKTILNGWATPRRLRSLSHGMSAHCPFCTNARDELEHYPFCPVVRAFYVSIGCRITCTEDFMALGRNLDRSNVLKYAKALSVMYQSRNALIRGPSPSLPSPLSLPPSPVSIINAFATAHNLSN